MEKFDASFGESFETLTGRAPFPWQRALYCRFVGGEIPKVTAIPTGLGKTNVIAVWLIALANGAQVPRRLVYVVNRRTVVDQTTNEVERLRSNLGKPALSGLRASLKALCAMHSDEDGPPLAISTLRGQFADNQEWAADPSRPAVICGTVDMIGSRLLFSGYRIGFKSRPLHAGFLGWDALLVHDEAHLEPAFQRLLKTIVCEQKRERQCGADLPRAGLRVMALSATVRSGEDGQSEPVFELTEDEQNPPENIPHPPSNPIHVVWRRLKATKRLVFNPVGDGRDAVAKKIGELAAGHKDSNAAVLVFIRTIKELYETKKELDKTKRCVISLTGTMRGKERDELVEKPDFKRFLKNGETGATVYLLCTAAGEVGIDISADHMVCDLTTFESMVQRLGRVNRYGDCSDTRIDVVYPKKFDEKDKFDKKDKLTRARKATLELLQKLPKIKAENETIYDASPKALGLLMEPLSKEERKAAFSPQPIILPATDILFDAWAMTSIRGNMPGRPLVEKYLHRLAKWEPPETHVAWREEVGVITDGLLETYKPEDLLDDYPLKPHELLRDRSDRVLKHLKTLAERHADAPVWIVDDRDVVETSTLEKLTNKGQKDRINGRTILLPPSVGGLADGMLDSNEQFSEGKQYDVADITDGPNQRVRVHPDDPDYGSKTAGMRCVRTIELDAGDEEDVEPRRWEWYESFPLEGGRTAKKAVAWETHVNDVAKRAESIVAGLRLPPEISQAVIIAAKLHDHGKRRKRFQITLGNCDFPKVVLAKSGRKGARLPESFRHEFASLFDAQADAEFAALSPELHDLVLHLIAAHHGRARPHFELDEAFDPERPSSDAAALAMEVPRRFARLQRKYGRWGLAYLESLLRAADWAASAAPSKYVEDEEAGK